MSRKGSHTYVYRATVGKGDFPVDMLRYDRCFPATEMGDSSKIGSYYTEQRVVVVTKWTCQPNAPDFWTPERWRSFGWEMVTVDYPNSEDARRAGETVLKGGVGLLPPRK